MYPYLPFRPVSFDVVVSPTTITKVATVTNFQNAQSFGFGASAINSAVVGISQ